MYQRFSSYLYYKIALLVLIFSIGLIALIFFVVDYYYTDQDTILDAHEMYFYSQLVSNWDFPNDSLLIKQEIANLNYDLSIYAENDKSLVWAHPKIVNPDGYSSFVDSDVLGEIHNINIPQYVSFGKNNLNENLTFVKHGGLVYFFTIRQNYTSEYINYIPPLAMLLMFMFGLNYFIQFNLRPIKLMKKRIYALREGNLTDEVPIISNDELADLSRAMNKMIKDIKSLLGQKQQLLLDVSHELRSPLARMRLLIEMIPEHKNQEKLIGEIIFLEGMISNLLLSDKLSLPYSNLDYQPIKIDHLILNTLDVVNLDGRKININNQSQHNEIVVDITKMIIALRNLVDNAIKYGLTDEEVKINIISHNNDVTISIINFGQELCDSDKKDIFKPFFRSSAHASKASGFGLGLTICEKIIHAHLGVLELQTCENETRFNITIPIKPVGENRS